MHPAASRCYPCPRGDPQTPLFLLEVIFGEEPLGHKGTNAPYHLRFRQLDEDFLLHPKRVPGVAGQ